MIKHFDRCDRIKLTELNKINPNQLTVNQRITKAVLSEKLQKLHLKRSQARLKKAKQLLPLLTGQKLLKNYHVKNYQDFRNNYFVVSKDLARKTNNFKAITNLTHKPRSDGNRPVNNPGDATPIHNHP